MVVSENSVEQSICRILEAHREALRGHRVLLFGSRADGTAGHLSDFDLGVDGSEPLDLESFYELQDALDQIPTLYQVDWMDLARASPKISENARRQGKILYEG
jgi:predicted nucleotidyltransferase